MERKPQQQTLSIRISETLREFLERSKQVLSSGGRGESVSTSDVAKILLESAKEDRLDFRLEVADLQQDPTASLVAIRRKWQVKAAADAIGVGLPEPIHPGRNRGPVQGAMPPPARVGIRQPARGASRRAEPAHGPRDVGWTATTWETSACPKGRPQRATTRSGIGAADRRDADRGPASESRRSKAAARRTLLLRSASRRVHCRPDGIEPGARTAHAALFPAGCAGPLDA